MSRQYQHTVLVSALLTFGILGAQVSLAQNTSFELMCRNKAKEIAAETYKNCVTENRQKEVSQIREEYKQKLAELKAHYDKELKNVGSGLSTQQSSTIPAVESSSNSTAIKKTPKTKRNSQQRASGARSLPQKSVQTETIDFTETSKSEIPATTSSAVENNPVEMTTSAEAAESRSSNENQGLSDSEVVELPVQ